MDKAAEWAAEKFTVAVILPVVFWPITLLVLCVLAYMMFKSRRWRWHLIDVMLFVGCWIAALSVSGANPPITFMSRYSTADFIVYMKVMVVLAVLLFIISLLSFRFLGGSLGKRIAGFTTVQIDGSGLSWPIVLVRTLVIFSLGVLIVSPGPLIGYLFGNGSEIASLIVLFLAFGVWLYVVAFREKAVDGVLGQTRLERYLQIMTIESR